MPTAMAQYFLHVKTFGRGRGSSVTKAAAYRAGERIKDEGLGAVHDYTERTDVVHAEILLPSEHAGKPEMEWALDRAVLWNAVQGSGRQRNSRLAREVLVLLPGELTRGQRLELVRGFSQGLADRYGGAVDFSLHAPRATADERHHHAHILMTCRQVGPDGIGARTHLELSGTERHERGLPPSKDELLWMREGWATAANQALRDAGLAARIDHRSYAAQGIDREPQARIPPPILYAERRLGTTTAAGDAIRARHRERVEARQKGPDELARVVQRQKAEGRQRMAQRADRSPGEELKPRGAVTREELRERRREYLKANAAEINRKQRERRRANAAEVNRKQREYLQKRKTQKLERGRPLSPSYSRSRAPRKSAADDAVKQWLAYRERQSKSPEQSAVDQWRAYRESHAPEGATLAAPRDRSRTVDAERTDDARSSTPARGRTCSPRTR